ncbi:MAG: AzlD domain-containing protein [Deltaproteobacteria bacterium]|nr:AzlD domain-containing protein [Deltaproteobacteria bacterium]
MTDHLSIAWLILGMFVVTFPVRFIPLFIFNRIAIPQWAKIWLSYVPLALFSAFVTQIYAEPINAFHFWDKIPLIISGITTLGVTVKTKSLGWGMSLGFFVFVIAVYFLK